MSGGERQATASGTQIAIMNLGRPNAPRKRARLVALAVLLAAASAQAAEPQLTLPLVAVLSVSMAGSAARALGAEAPGGGPHGLLGLLPKQLQVPDGYTIDLYKAPPRWASGLDSDRLVGFDLFHQKGRGWTGTLAYDVESRGPLGASDDLIRLFFEYRF